MSNPAYVHPSSITLKRGDSWDYLYQLFSDSTNEPIVLSGHTVVWVWKRTDSPEAAKAVELYYNKSGETAKATLTSIQHGGTPWEGAGIVFSLADDETAALELGTYYTEIAWNTASGKRYTTNAVTITVVDDLNPDN